MKWSWKKGNMNNLKKKSHIFVIVYRILFIYRVKIVTMIVFYLCMKTQRTKPSISRFTAVARLRSQSETVAQVLILSTKSAKGCKGAEWIVNFWLAKMDAQWLLLIRLMKYVMLLNFICLFAFWRFCCALVMFVKSLVLTIK